MKAWTASVRRYPHFDPVISEADAEAVATDPKRVAAHTFYPFLKYDEGWTAYAKKGKKGKRKDRPIRFAARLDSCIFSYYRYLLSKPYEARLSSEALSNSVIAYRRIPKLAGGGGQSNIDFARSAVEAIQSQGNCCAIALDISSFFETLDHLQLRDVWANLLGVARLPDDHFKVFKAITRYAFVDVKKAYIRLGYYGDKTDKHGRTRPGYLVSRDKIPVQLCDGKTFREKIGRSSTQPSIIEVNPHAMGVPQGAPLSDLLANAYLLEFDKHLRDICTKLGGCFFRYSDDILVIAPISANDAIALEKDIRDAITLYGKGLVIKEEKSAIHQFESKGSKQNISTIKASDKDGKPMPNKPFEYLGFRYDGRHVYIRDKTMSNLHRKIASVCRAVAIRQRKRYQGKAYQDILALTNCEKVIQVFGSVEDFHSKAADYRAWTFTTYAKRASKTMGELGKPIPRQLKNLRAAVYRRLDYELSRV
ncbi:reverse transcriptase domain-containing protein [Rhizobium lemnae]|uniref:Reverse transcriptase domain-containing protein n=1 Tax=Rhizobium lemnae TaxID=1214924 RepID=A0ABV8E4C5_9HYPH|nr:reverse transcriptase domain-containing protein [Rhizobium lemnae]MCJ8506777.1 reverse transcriptase domain-containing protein [Rhizobium lemnae]